MPNYRKLTPDELRLAAEQGIQADENAVIDEQGNIGYLESSHEPRPGEMTPQGEQPLQETKNEASGAPPISKLPGIAARTIAGSAIPVVFGRGAGALAGLALGAPTTGPGAVLTTLGGGLVGGLGAQLGQDYLLNKYAANHPGGWIDRFQRARAEDAREYPKTTAALSLGTMPLAGGGLPSIPRSAAAIRQALLGAGIQGGVNVGTQKILNPDAPIDLASTAIQALGGAALSRPIPRLRGLERAALSNADPRFTERFAPEIDPPKLAPQGTRTTLASEKENYDKTFGRTGAADELLSGTVSKEAIDNQARSQAFNAVNEQLNTLGKEEKFYARLLDHIEKLPEGSEARAVAESNALMLRRSIDERRAKITGPVVSEKLFQGKTEERPTGVTTDELKKPSVTKEEIEQPTPIEGAAPIPKPQGYGEGLGPQPGNPSIGATGAALAGGKGMPIPMQAPTVRVPAAAQVRIPKPAPEGVTPPEIAAEQAASRKPLVPEVEKIIPPKEAIDPTIEAMAAGKEGVSPVQVPEGKAPPKYKKTYENPPSGTIDLKEWLRRNRIQGKEAGSMLNPFQGKVGDKIEGAINKTRKIVAAAFKDKGTGKIYNTGPFHKWVEGMPRTNEGLKTLDNGFLLDDGTFITRQQAEDLTGEMPFAEYMSFNKQSGSVINPFPEREPSPTDKAIAKTKAYIEEARQEGWEIPINEDELPKIIKKLDKAFTKSADIDPAAAGLTTKQAEFLRSAGIIGGNIRTMPYRIYKNYGESGSIINPFPSIQRGFARVKEVAGEALESAKRWPKSETKIAHPLDPISQFRQRVTASAPERLARTGEEGEHIAKLYSETLTKERMLDYPVQQDIKEARKFFRSTLTPAERENVIEYKKDLFYNGTSSRTLNPKEQAALARIKDIEDIWTIRKSRPDAPWVTETDAKGNTRSRPFKIRFGWTPLGVTMKPEVQEILRNQSKYPDQYKYVAAKFAQDWSARHGITPEAALELFNRHYNVAATTERNPNAEFASLRFAEGMGVPREFAADDIFQALSSYSTRASKDLAYHQTLETDPVFAKSLGAEDNGRGQSIPNIVTTPSGRAVVKGLLGGNEDIKTMLRDYIGASVPGQGRAEGGVHLATALAVGTASQAKDIFSVPSGMLEITGIKDAPKAIDGLLAMFNPKAWDKAIRGGSVRPVRQLTPTVAMEANTLATKLADLWSKVTFSEKFSQAGRVFADGWARAVIDARARAGDFELLKEFGPSNLGSYSYDEAKNFAASRIVQHVTSNYSAEKLPPQMTRGSGSALRPLLSLTRYPVERFNRWYDKAYEPALRGNLGPLIRSALGGLVMVGAYNTIKEAITKRKPRELDWKEYLNLPDAGAREGLYTLFSKFDTLAYAGIASQLAFMSLQAASKEAPQGFNNMLLAAVEQTTKRVAQYAGAVAEGDVDPITGLGELGMQILKDRIQLVSMTASAIGEDRGNREERIARRTGYMVQTGDVSKDMNNPFSASAAYRNEDPRALGKILANRARAGQRLTAPEAEYEGRYTPRFRGGRVVNYYNFIEDTQGPEAAAAAKARDIEATQRKYQTLSTAIRR